MLLLWEYPEVTSTTDAFKSYTDKRRQKQDLSPRPTHPQRSKDGPIPERFLGSFSFSAENHHYPTPCSGRIIVSHAHQRKRSPLDVDADVDQMVTIHTPMSSEVTVDG